MEREAGTVHWGRGHGHEYDEPQPAPEHRPELDHFHAAIHRGAIGVIRTYDNRPGYEHLVRGARRLLEFDIAHARTPEQRTAYIDELHRCLLGED
jgi:hypothetical protein